MNTCKHQEALDQAVIDEGDVYVHIKSGKEYAIVDAGTLRDADSGEYLIGYQEVDDPSAQIWMHTLSNFMATNDDGTPRFELLQAAILKDKKCLSQN